LESFIFYSASCCQQEKNPAISCKKDPRGVNLRSIELINFRSASMSSSSMMAELAVFPELSGMGVQVLQEPAPPTLPVDPSTNISSSTMDPEMYFAAKEGNVLYLRSVTKLVNVCVSSFLTPQKNTVLHIAVRFLQLEFAAQVLRSDPSLLFQPNSKGDSPLHVAARCGHIETVRLLVSNYREQQRQQQRDLESGGSMQNNNIPNTAEWMRATNSDHNTALHEALIAKSPDIALMLLEEDAGLASCENNAMESPLYLSASFGFHHVVRRILDINVGTAARLKGLRGRNGQTPLHAVAMFRGRVDISEHVDGEGTH